MESKRIGYAQACLKDNRDYESFVKLCDTVKPYALFVYNGKKNIIPYFDWEDYLQEVSLVVWNVLERVRCKPDILDSFSAYLNASIRYMYYSKFRNYVMKNAVERGGYEGSSNGVYITRIVYYAGYVETVKKKISEYHREYNSRPNVKERKKINSHTHYLSNSEEIKKRAKEWAINNPNARKEITKRYRDAHRDELRRKGREYYRKKKFKSQASLGL